MLQVPIKWPQSRDEVWKANIPHTHLAHEKSDQNWMVVKGEKIVFPGGGTHFHYGADKYIAAMANVSLHLALLVLPIRKIRSYIFYFQIVSSMGFYLYLCKCLPTTNNENVFAVFHLHLMAQKFQIIPIFFFILIN